MRETLSLFSYWGGIFAVAAVTLFVTMYLYKLYKRAPGTSNLIDDLRRRSVAIYLAAETSSSGEISNKLRAAADEIERLRDANRVMFWLIIAMNAVVICLLALGYKIF